MALSAVQFSNIFRGSMPPIPPREAPTSGGRFVCDEKKILLGETE